MPKKLQLCFLQTAIPFQHINTHMRFYEFKTIKPIQPLTPGQSRINALKQQKERASTQLKAERTRQKQDKARDRVIKAQQALAKANLGYNKNCRVKRQFLIVG